MIKTKKPIDYQKILAAPWAPPPNNSTYIMYTLFDNKFEMLNWILELPNTIN